MISNTLSLGALPGNDRLSPEEELVVALIRVAYEDLHGPDEDMRESAEDFFVSAFFRDLADAIGLSQATRRRLVPWL